MSVIKFVLVTPTSEHGRIYVAPVKGKNGLFNFALFPELVQLTEEQNKIITTAISVTKMSEPGVASRSPASPQ